MKYAWQFARSEEALSPGSRGSKEILTIHCSGIIMGAKWPRNVGGRGTVERAGRRILSELMSLIMTGYKITPFAPGRSDRTRSGQIVNFLQKRRRWPTAAAAAVGISGTLFATREQIISL